MVENIWYNIFLSFTYSTRINLENPYAVKNSQDGQMLQIYLGSSPSPFCPNGRSDDLSILTHAISQADEFVYVAVSDYGGFQLLESVKSTISVEKCTL